MAAPVLSKTWQFDVNRQVGNLGALPLCNQHAMSSLKESLKGFALSAWTVWGSCYGHSTSPVFGNGDGVDNWLTVGVADPTKLVWGTGNHSWIVLAQVGMGPKTAICIDLNNVNSYSATVVFSPAAGFGLANGGTDGTASTRPTASDQIVLLNGAAWGGYNGAYTWRQHAMVSQDGQCTRIFLMRNGASSGIWLFETVKNPVTGWAAPLVAAVYGDNALNGIASYATFSTAANTWGRIGADPCSFYMTGEGYGATGLQTIITVPDDESGEWQLLPIGLQSATSSHRGRKGELYDMWWIPAGGGSTTYPEDDTRQLLGFGHFAIPWDGSVPWGWT